MIDMLRKYEIGEGNGCEEIVKCLLSFILLLSFTGTLVQAEETTSMSVEKAIQVFKQQGKNEGDSGRVHRRIYAKSFEIHERSG